MIYGIAPVIPDGKEGYAVIFGLWLNMARAHARHVLAVAQGIAYGSSLEEVPMNFFESVSISARQAYDAAFDTNAERHAAKIKARPGVHSLK